MSVVERERVEEVVAPRRVTDADVAWRAADLLEEFGWKQGDYGSLREGRFCLVGALMQASRDLGWEPSNDISWGHPNTYSLLGVGTPWNDEPGRTKEEVVARLRSAERSTHVQP